MRVATFHEGRAVLVLGDAMQLLRHFGPYDAVLTDPPYSSGGMMRGDRAQTTSTKYQSSGLSSYHEDFSGDNRDQRGFLVWSSLWMQEALAATVVGGVLGAFSDWRQLPVTTDAVQVAGWVWRGVLPWDKRNSRPVPNRFRAQCEYLVWGSSGPMNSEREGARYLPGVVRQAVPATKSRQHSTQKPVELMREVVKIAPPDGLVCDPFMGSGTTGVAAIEEGRRFVGFEMNAHYFDVACARVEEMGK